MRALVRTKIGRYSLVGPPRLDLESFAGRAGLHPDLVRRLVALGLLEPYRDAAGHLWFAPEQLAEVARIERLRAGFCLNYAAVGLVCDLLDRIADLEAALRRRSGRTGGSSWT
ncbi:chaperone modulator CbpM [Actinomadura sp. HBU206391]|uniref:chaperone modulator CbpM n=1 Tax=Actinomadura sp. HBU206391 TaxID=2731692 RepID=UPI001650B1E4|nr:chaperone modulator CbpM [Actinomadura sp. HBU206391]MBC6458933.1 MerR family transcriptional regulator [Actinomadura sp. HBU206391]